MLLTGVLNASAQQPYAVLSTDNTTLTFYYDLQKSSREGMAFGLNTEGDYPGWNENPSTVTKVVFDSSFADARPTCCDFWFSEMENLESISGLNYLNTSSVTSMEWMFSRCSKLTSLNVSGFNTENVYDMTGMFSDCSKLINLDVSGFKTENVTLMDYMFSSCRSLTSIDVSSFNTSKVVNTSYMFYGCENLTTIDVSDWDVGQVETMKNMFDGCKKLSSLDLSSFVFFPGAAPLEFSNEYYERMLANCSGLKTLIIPSTADKLHSTSCTGVGTQSAPCTLVYPDGFTPQKTATGDGWYKWKGGYFKDAIIESYAVFDNSTLTFYFDGKKSVRTGNVYNLNTGSDRPAWYVKMYDVTSVVFDPSFANARPTSCHDWFSNFHNLTSITGFNYLNTSEVTDMAVMFCGCEALTTIDVSHFNTGKVTDMHGMFLSCDNLENIIFGNFNTANATDIGYMFASCKKLSSLDLSSFNTANVTDMSDMFDNCRSLKNLDLSNFNTDKVTTMESMFNYCVGLNSLKISSFNTDNVTNMRRMFAGCESLTNIDLSNFNTGSVTNMSEMFYDCENLNSLDVSNFNTVNVTSMNRMFNYCTSLTSVDVSNFNTAKVTQMDKMFWGCESLTSLDVSNFVIPENTTMMFTDCLGLKWLSIPSTASRLIFDEEEFYYDSCEGVGTKDAPCTLVYPDGFTPQKTSTGDGWYMWKGGYFKDAETEAYAVLSTDNTKLTFYCDEKKFSRKGTAYNLNAAGERPGWAVDIFNNQNITKVEFDPSFADARPTSCRYWFLEMEHLTSITGIEYLKTDNVTDMNGMFEGCYELTSLDVSGFKTENVTDMTRMFSGCYELTCLDVSGFKTENVTLMDYMFSDCRGLTSIDVSGFNTANVRSMSGMFEDCFYMASLDLSVFTFNKDMYTDGLLRYCYDLKTLIVPATANLLNSNACTDVGSKSAPCTLIYPDGLELNPTSTGDGWYRWKGGFFKDAETEAYAVINGSTMTFYYDKSRVLKPGTSYGMDLFWGIMPQWSNDKSGVETVVFTPAFSNYRPSSCYNWFSGMSLLSTITGLEYLNTADVTSMNSMFSGCSSLTSLDLRSFDVSNVTNMCLMFFNCSSLTSLDLSSFNTANVTTFQDMFRSCSNLKSLDLSSFNTEKVTSMQNMFQNCSSLTSLDISSFNTAKVTNMGSMFQNCSSMTSIDISHFILKPTNYFSNMFNGCSSLTSLDLSNFSFAEKVEYYSTKMLYNCTSLKTLTIPATADKLWDDAFSGVGSEANPCTLIYPDELVLEPTSTGNGWFLWKEGYFKNASEMVMGDANGDGKVSVVDVMMTVNYVLGLNPEGFHFNNANVVNDDNTISVTDVMGIVSIVLGKTNSQAPAQSRTSAVDGIGIAANNGLCTVALNNSEPFNALQFTIVMPEKAKLGNVAMMTARANGHHVKAQAVAPGRYNMVVFATSGAPLRDGTTALLHFDFTGCQPGDIAIEGAQLVNSQYETILPTGIVTDITGIEMDGDADSQPYYNTVGIGVKTPNRGVYIKNGKKVVVK